MPRMAILATLNTFESICRDYRARAERALAARLPGADSAAAPARLAAAMRYACLGGGKRFRALLVYAAGELAGAAADALDAAAAAVEFVHAYSLIHDDLPVMDDDDLRRGRPACHIAFDEATAILAGDALQTHAFEILSGDPALAGLPAARRLRMVATLAVATGARGMAGGQALDMQATGRDSVADITVTDTVATADSDTVTVVTGDTGDSTVTAPAQKTAGVTAGGITVDQLVHMHGLKTGALIRAAVKLGALAAADDVDGDERIRRLDDYAAHLGLAFQIADDILDAEAGGDGDVDGRFGKRGGGDARMQKATYAEVLGLRGARAEAQKHADLAVEAAAALRDFGDNAGGTTVDAGGNTVANNGTVTDNDTVTDTGAVTGKDTVTDTNTVAAMPPADFLAHLARFAVTRRF